MEEGTIRFHNKTKTNTWYLLLNIPNVMKV